MIDQRFYSRKFILSMLIQLAAIAGLFMAKLTGAEFTTISGTVVAAYSAANAVCRYVEAKGA